MACSLKRAVQACLADLSAILSTIVPQHGTTVEAWRRRKRILNPLSMKLLEGDLKPGDKIKVSASYGELVFAKK
jgi:hypothetical protein